MADTPIEVGPCRPFRDVGHLMYQGPDARLRGKGALVAFTKDGQLVAQFDDMDTGYAFGWWPFNDGDFEAPEYAILRDHADKGKSND